MKERELSVQGAKVSGIENLNIILGKNGAGKSRFLRKLDAGLFGDDHINVTYISPERGGVFQREGHVVTNMENNDNWLSVDRRKNQAKNFKAVSAQLLRDIETSYLRELQNNFDVRMDPSRNFLSDKLDKINKLFSNIQIVQEKSDFIFKTLSGDRIKAEELSSGESEAVSLAVEILFFFQTIQSEKFNIILIDEPDAHLHPDLQARLMHLLIREIENLKENDRVRAAVFIATHSTPMISAIAMCDFATIGTKHFDNELVDLTRINKNIKKVGPFFGHPLSLILSNDVMLILEGDDDERVWQQASRSSNSRINVFPVLAKSVDVQGEMEHFCKILLTSIYDNPIAYSIRDGDGKIEELNTVGPVTRFRLHCYAIENTLTTKECLNVIGCNWEKFQQLSKEWIKDNSKHRDVDLIKKLIGAKDRLRHEKIKNIRQLICSIANSNKPWEVVVGQAIAGLRTEDFLEKGNHLASYLGNKLVKTIVVPPSRNAASTS